MIETFAELLQAFAAEEASKLDAFDLKHAPTIGAMYEGLSGTVLEKAIPQQLDLRVVNGFVVDPAGSMSGQIDCMVVRGDGEKVPFTDSFKWPIWDVLAVFEVKKSLYAADLVDSFLHLGQVSQAFSDWLYGCGEKEGSIDISSALRAFTKITGVQAPNFNDHKFLDEPLQLIYHTLIMEQLAPVSIIVGYGGYKTEKSLRESLLKFLTDKGHGPGLGVPSFPSQIICNDISLVKASGQPYIPPMQDEYWDFFLSTRTNPLWPMLELLWAKIENECDVSMPWGDDLTQEAFSPFLAAKPILESGKGGWMYRYIPLLEDGEEPAPTTVQWEPPEVDKVQFVIFSQLCEKEIVDITDSELIAYLDQEGVSVDALVKTLQKTGLVALDGNLLRPSTQNLCCVIAPNGKYYVGENNTGRMSKYICQLSTTE